jgi:hypothetical protein
MQRRSNPPDHAAHQLATRRAGIDNLAPPPPTAIANS